MQPPLPEPVVLFGFCKNKIVLMNRILSVNNSEGEDRSIVLELYFQGMICFISIFFLNKIVTF